MNAYYLIAVLCYAAILLRWWVFGLSTLLVYAGVLLEREDVWLLLGYDATTLRCLIPQNSKDSFYVFAGDVCAQPPTRQMMMMMMMVARMLLTKSNNTNTKYISFVGSTELFILFYFNTAQRFPVALRVCRN